MCRRMYKVLRAPTLAFPPSSLMSLLRANRSIAGVVLGDFDEAFRNPFYQSHLDGPRAGLSAEHLLLQHG